MAGQKPSYRRRPTGRHLIASAILATLGLSTLAAATQIPHLGVHLPTQSRNGPAQAEASAQHAVSRSYLLPTGVLGVVSTLVTFSGVFAHVSDRSPLNLLFPRQSASSPTASLSSTTNAWPALILAALALLGTAPAAILTVIRCHENDDPAVPGRCGWPLVLVALGELLVVVAAAGAAGHRALCVRLGQMGSISGVDDAVLAVGTAVTAMGEKGAWSQAPKSSSHHSPAARRRHLIPASCCSSSRSSGCSPSPDRSGRPSSDFFRGDEKQCADNIESAVATPTTTTPALHRGQATSPSPPSPSLTPAPSTTATNAAIRDDRRRRRPDHLWHPSWWATHVYLPGLALTLVGAAAARKRSLTGDTAAVAHELVVLAAVALAPLVLWLVGLAWLIATSGADLTGSDSGSRGLESSPALSWVTAATGQQQERGRSYHGHHHRAARPQSRSARRSPSRGGATGTGDLVVDLAVPCLVWAVLCVAVYVQWSVTTTTGSGWFAGPPSHAAIRDVVLFWAFFVCGKLPVLASR